MRLPARSDANDWDKIIDSVISIVRGVRCGKAALANEDGGTSADPIETVVSGPVAWGINENYSVALIPATEEARDFWQENPIWVKSVDRNSFTVAYTGDGAGAGDLTYNWIAVQR